MADGGFDTLSPAWHHWWLIHTRLLFFWQLWSFLCFDRSQVSLQSLASSSDAGIPDYNYSSSSQSFSRNIGNVSCTYSYIKDFSLAIVASSTRAWNSKNSVVIGCKVHELWWSIWRRLLEFLVVIYVDEEDFLPDRGLQCSLIPQ